MRIQLKPCERNSRSHDTTFLSLYICVFVDESGHLFCIYRVYVVYSSCYWSLYTMEDNVKTSLERDRAVMKQHQVTHVCV